MTSDEVIADLNERIDNGLEILLQLQRATSDFTEKNRIDAKASGLRIVKDWLRSYPKDPPTCGCYTFHEDMNAGCPLNS